MLNVSLTTFLVCPLIIGTSVEERAPERTFATPVRVTRPESREACSKGARGVMGRKSRKNSSFPSPLALPFSRFGNTPHRLWSPVNKVSCIPPLTLFLIYHSAFDWKQRQKYHCCPLVCSPVCSAICQNISQNIYWRNMYENGLVWLQGL